MTNYSGLSMKEVKEHQDIYGKNEITCKRKEKLIKKIFHIFKEPIYLIVFFLNRIFLFGRTG